MSKKVKIFILGLAIVGVCSNFTTINYAQAENVQSDSKDLTKSKYKISDDGFKYIEYENGTLGIIDYIGDKSDVIVPSNIDGKEVKELIGNGFSNNSTVKNIKISEGILRIEGEMFAVCKNLESISLPNSLESLSCLVIGCENLKGIDIPKNVSEINCCFDFCTKLNYINVDKDNVNFAVHDNILYTKDMSRLILAPKNIISADIPEGVKEIEYGAFNYCKKLEKINLPSTLTTIGDSAFSNCISLTNIFLPQNVLKLEGSPFSFCVDLDIQVDEDNEIFSSQDGVLYNKNKTELIECANNFNKVNVPDTVTSIKGGAFYGTYLSQIVIPRTINSIGSGAFACSCVNSILIPNNVTYIENEIFSQISKYVTIYGEKGSYAETYAKENDIVFKLASDFNKNDNNEEEKSSSEPLTPGDVIFPSEPPESNYDNPDKIEHNQYTDEIDEILPPTSYTEEQIKQFNLVKEEVKELYVGEGFTYETYKKVKSHIEALPDSFEKDKLNAIIDRFVISGSLSSTGTPGSATPDNKKDENTTIATTTKPNGQDEEKEPISSADGNSNKTADTVSLVGAFAMIAGFIGTIKLKKNK